MKIQLSNHFTFKKLFRFVLPSIVMMVFTSIYGVVDGLFVSNFAGKTPFAAINIIMPFIMILGGIGFMIGTGGSALVSKTLGEGDREKANKYFSMLIYMTLVFGVILSIIGIIFLAPISKLLGATDEMLPYCVTYGRTVLVFNAAFMLQNVFQSLLVTAEKPKFGLFVTVASGVTNMVLDALFIAGFNMGVFGAALATGISQIVGGIIPLIYFMKKNSTAFFITKTKLDVPSMLKVCANGSSELMSNISSSLVSIVYNLQLLKYLGEDGVSAYGVLMYVQFIFIAIFVGYAIGTAPIIGYHYGSGNDSELKSLLKKSMLLMGVGGLVLATLAKLMGPMLANIFVGYDEGLCELTTHAFDLFAYSFILAGINIFTSSLFTALNNGGVSAAVSFLRTLVFQMAAIFILPEIIGVDGIWLAVTAAEIFATIISLIFLFAKRKKYKYM